MTKNLNYPTMKYMFLFFAYALILQILADKAYADALVIWDTRSIPSITDSSHPSLHGRYLTWQAKEGLAGTISTKDDWEIFVYDLSLKTITQLTDDTLDDTLPKTDGTYIVWQKYDTTTGSQIFLYQLSGNSPQGGSRISTAVNGDHFSPDIAEGNVIWSRQQIGQFFLPKEILLYNAVEQTDPLVISDPQFYSNSPRIAGSQIVFLQENPDGTEALLYLYDVKDEQPVAKLAPEGFIWIANPQVEGEQTVLSRYNGTDREIFLHTPSEGYTQITRNNLDDIGPIISQNYIAWTANSDIFLADTTATAVRFFWPMFYPAIIGAGPDNR